jgi:plasmid stabilization system protein ParE
VGFGEEFLSSVDASVQLIRRAPEMYAAIFETYRRCLIRRFPYAIFYEHAAGAVTVYGIFHTSRDPAKWRERLS